MTITNYIAVFGIVIAAGTTLFIWLASRYLNNVEGNAILKTEVTTLKTMLQSILNKMDVLEKDIQNLDTFKEVFQNLFKETNDKVVEQQAKISKLEIRLEKHLSEREGASKSN